MKPAAVGKKHIFRKPPSLAKNTVFNVVSSILRLMIGLVVSPILFWKLGAESYGLWSVIWAFSGTLELMDLRLGAAATPLVASARETGDNEQIIRLANTGFFFYGLLGLVTMVAAFGLMQIQAVTAWIPDNAQQDATLIIPAAVVVFSLSTIISLTSGLLQGLQRYDVTSTISVAVGIVRAALLIGIALAGGGLTELVLAEAGMVALRCLLLLLSVRRNIQGFRFLPHPSRDAFKALFSFGAKLEIAHAAHLISMHLDKLLLTAFLGLEVVAFYDLGAKLVGVARSLPMLLISATLPVASSLEASGEKERLWEFYEKGTGVLAWTGMPIFLWTAIGAGPLLFAWAGVTELEARITVWILALGYFINVYCGMANSIAVGIGKPELEMRRSMLAGLLNVVLSGSLLYLIGFPGAPIGSSLALIAGSIYLFSTVHSHFKRPLYTFVKPLIPTLLPAVPAGIGAYLIMMVSTNSRFEVITSVIVAAIFIGAVYLLAGMRFGIFTRAFLESVRNPAEPSE
jgi:O-antigen/teichoic acid export membrane protein